MNFDHLPDRATNFLKELMAVSAVREMWLIGSRANGNARSDSDTDVLIFGDSGLIELLKRRRKVDSVDCLVCEDGKAFEDPWQAKSGNLEQWRWKVVDKEARYRSVRFIKDDETSAEFGAEMGQFEEQWNRGVLLYSRGDA